LKWSIPEERGSKIQVENFSIHVDYGPC